MKHQNSSTVDRLVTLASQADQIIARGIASHDIRQACALARGYLELARSYGEPLSVEDVERVLERLGAAVKAALPRSNRRRREPLVFVPAPMDVQEPAPQAMS
jgi:hypothetical protein